MAKRKDKSAHQKMSKNEKVKVAAELEAIAFLNNIYEGYDQDSTKRFAIRLGDKFKFLDTPEQIPVISDTNVNQLQNLLVKFYNRTVDLSIK